MRRILRKILRKLGKLREIPEIMQSAPEGCVRGKGTLFYHEPTEIDALR